MRTQRASAALNGAPEATLRTCFQPELPTQPRGPPPRRPAPPTSRVGPAMCQSGPGRSRGARGLGGGGMGEGQWQARSGALGGPHPPHTDPALTRLPLDEPGCQPGRGGHSALGALLAPVLAPVPQLGVDEAPHEPGLGGAHQEQHTQPVGRGLGGLRLHAPRAGGRPGPRGARPTATSGGSVVCAGLRSTCLRAGRGTRGRR